MTLQINGFTLSQSIKRTTKPFISFSQFKNGTTFFNVSLPPTFLNKFSAIWHYLEKLYKFHFFFPEFNLDRWFHVKSAKNDKNSFTSNKASDISLGVIHFVIGLISSKVSLTSGSLNLTTNSNSFWSVSKEDDSTASFHLSINLNSKFPAKISQNSWYYLRWFLSQGLKFLLYNFIWRTYRDCRKINIPNWVICGIQSC